MFARLSTEGRIERTPVVEVPRRHWREVALTALVRTGQQTPFYIFTTYVLAYGTQTLKLPQTLLLDFVMIQALLSLGTIPLFGHLSDRIGRRRITAIGCAAMMVFPFVYFRLIDTARIPLVFAAIVLGLPIQDLQYGPQAALIAESFPARLRYSGSSLGYQLASVTAGGPAPIVALWLFERYRSSTAVAVYVSLSAVVSLVALSLLPDRSGSDLDGA